MVEIGAPFTALQLSQAILTLNQEGTALAQRFDARTFFAPQGSAWSPAEHFRHLRKATAPITFALRLPGWALMAGFGSQTAPSRSYPAIRDLYRASLIHSRSAGIFAPRPQPPPTDPPARRADILRAWHRAVLAFTQAVQRWPEPALDRLRLPHPRLGRLSLREMAAFTVYHTAHHLGRVAERASPELDSPGS